MRRSFALLNFSRADVEYHSDDIWHRLDFLIMGKLLGFCHLLHSHTVSVQQILWPVEIGGSQWLAQHGVSLGQRILIGWDARSQRLRSSLSLACV